MALGHNKSWVHGYTKSLNNIGHKYMADTIIKNIIYIHKNTLIYI